MKGNDDAVETVEFVEEIETDVWIEDESGPGLIPRMLAEVAGTFILVLLGVGVALTYGFMSTGTLFIQGQASGSVAFGSSTLVVGLAFGVAVIIGATAFAVISGAHFNPAISLGLWLAGRFPGRDVVPYILAQVIGALLAGAALFLTLGAAENADTETVRGLLQGVSNGWGEHAPLAGQGIIFAAAVAFGIELLATALLVLTVLGATDPRAPRGTAPFAIGLALAFLVIFAIPFTNAALNPARASATALFAGDWAMKELWLFWVAPLIGGAIVGLLYRAFGPRPDVEVIETIEVIED